MLEGLSIQNILLVVGIVAGGALVASISLFVLAAYQIAELEIPEDADFFETLQLVPITVPIALDLLDLAFDIFAGPIAWIILELLGLRALQMVTVFEGLLPGTQIIPTMTASWVIARVMEKRDKKSKVRSALYQYQMENPGSYPGLNSQNRNARRQIASRSRASQSGISRSRAEHPIASYPPEEIVEGEFYEEDNSPPDYWDDDDDDDLFESRS